MQQQGVITKVLPLGEGEKDGFPVIHITTVSAMCTTVSVILLYVLYLRPVSIFALLVSWSKYSDITCFLLDYNGFCHLVTEDNNNL